MSAAPSLSVIIACEKPDPRLPATLESVWAQRSAATELIVVDGGSDDGTRAWLDTQHVRLATIVSPPDACLYEAVNQAITQARGEWLLFLDAGDRLVGDRVLSETLNWMKKTDCGVVGGEAATDRGRLDKLRTPAHPIRKDFVPRAATFYRRGLFEENGSFDPALAAMARYELNVRLWKNRIRFKPIPLRITACGADRPFDWASAREEIRVRHRYYPAWRCWWWDLRSFARAAGSRR